MTNLTESPVYEPGVFRLETTTPIKGGDPIFVAGDPTDGFANAQAQQLANRTAFLKQEIDSLASEKEQLLIAGGGISIDRTDPDSPVISATATGAVSSVDGQTGVVDLSSSYAHLSHVGSRGAAHTNATTTEAGFMSAADKSKLNGIEAAATANQTDTYLLDRANHTGTQAISTVDGLQLSLDGKEYALTAGTNVTIDRTNPLNPIINARISGGGGGDVVGPASSVNNEVALFDGVTGKLIKGGGVLGDAAFTSSTNYATSTQGGLADTAVQPSDLATVATTGDYSDLSGLPVLGTAAATDSTAYATATQGALADTALQPDDIDVSVQSQLVSGANIKTINGESILGSGNIVISGGGGGGVTWSLISANGNVVGGSGYIIDNTTAGIALTLPSSPSAQASIRFTSLKKTNSWQIDPLTENINGVAGVMTVDIFGGFELVYINSTVGWVVV